jgi:hypothetical protein
MLYCLWYLTAITLKSAVHCPGGTVEECPDGQICYFGTPCDARLIRYTPAPIPAPKSDGEDFDTPTIIEEKEDSAAAESDDESDLISPADENVDNGLSGNSNFCGTTYLDASANCTREMHCPSGLSIDCPKGLECFSFLPDCNIEDMPTPAPTISLKPTSAAPTSSEPTVTPPPTGAPIGKDDMRYFFFCGTDWGDASTRCYMQCVSGFHSDCPPGEQCFAQANCPKGVIKGPPTTPAPITGTLSPTVSQTPSIEPTLSFAPTVYTTKSPEIFPTLMPTTAFPSPRPTLGTCEGDPVSSFCSSTLDTFPIMHTFKSS